MIGRTCCAPAIIGLLLLPTPVFAHRLHVFAHVHGTSIHGEADYADDRPVQNATVIALDPAGQELARVETDRQGKFTLEAQYRCDHRLVVETGDGHGGQYVLAAAELPHSLPGRDNAAHPHGARPGDESLEAKIEAVSRQIVALRNQLDRYERRIRLRDILGGTGYILGIAGIAFYFLGVKRKESR